MKKTILILSFLSTIVTIWSQNENFGLWYEMDLQKEVGKWTIGSDLEIRSLGLSHMERASWQLTGDYELKSWWQLGAGVTGMFVYDHKYAYNQPRLRFFIKNKFEKKLSRFKLEWKEKIRWTFKNETLRLKEDGEIDHYRVNPDLTAISSFEVKYDIPKSKLSPWVSVDAFLKLNDPEVRSFENWRTTLGVDYKVNKAIRLSIFGLKNSQLDSEDSYGIWAAGVLMRYRL
ncbi:MAG: DUF2490 domain-containing protein [Saprospiraceae bacterium]|nr:DUF2490 domain-containing protein [Saprospiraceae bacterium]